MRGNYTHWLCTHIVDQLKKGIWIAKWSNERLEEKNKCLKKFALRSMSMVNITKDQSLLPLRLLTKSRRVDALQIIKKRLEKFNQGGTNFFSRF